MKHRPERKWIKTVFCAGGLLLAALGAGRPARAQAPPIRLELDADARAWDPVGGVSRANLHTVALRLGADLAPGVRVQVYGTHQYDAYGLQQATVEKEWGGNAGRAQAGLVRLPFGIYDPRETYASGLIDYPMPRGDYAYHSVDWAAPGVFWSGGPPQLQVEAAAVSGRGTGIWNNQNLVRGIAARAQTYVGDAIIGVSHWEGALQDAPASPALPPVHMTGLDLRFTQSHLLLRGEYLFGTLAGDSTHGWYLDAYYRLPQHERWSLVGRLERFRPEADTAEARQATLGVRYVATHEWTLSANWRRNNGPSYKSWTPATARGGDFFLQAYRRVDW